MPGCFWKYLLYISPVSDNTELEVISSLNNFIGTSEAISYLTSTLIHQYFNHLHNIVSTRSPIYLHAVGKSSVLSFISSKNNNTVCTLLLDCGKQQLTITFSLSLHNVWFLSIDCKPMIPIFHLGSWKVPGSLLPPCMAVILTFLMKLSFCFVPFWVCPFYSLEWCHCLTSASY